MNPKKRHNRLHSATLVLGWTTVFVLCSSAVRASDLEIEDASISLDPNASTWYVTSRVCNHESGGHSGSLLYELRLTQGSSYYVIGSKSKSDTIPGGYCLTVTGMAISVDTSVPVGTYGIQLAIGEYSSGTWIGRDKVNFDRDFVRGGGSGSGSGGGSSGGGSGGSGGGGSGWDDYDDDICAAYGWYGDGVCDSFCPQPDPDCDCDGDDDSGGSTGSGYGGGSSGSGSSTGGSSGSGSGGSSGSGSSGSGYGGSSAAGLPSVTLCGAGFAVSTLGAMLGLCLMPRQRSATG